MLAVRKTGPKSEPQGTEKPAAPASVSAFTLLELVVVLAILVALATVVVPLVGNTISDSRETTTLATLSTLREQVSQYWLDLGKELPRPNPTMSPTRVDAPQLAFLFMNPNTLAADYEFNPAYRLGWRGPYVREATGSYSLDVPHGFTARYGETGDPAACDAWGRPIVLQQPGAYSGVHDVRLVSAGSNGRLEIDPVALSSSLTANDTGDDVYVAFELR